MTEIINHNRTQCQVIYDDSNRHNSEIYKLGREFLEECTDFVKNIIFLDDSPWKNDGIVRWATKQGIKLGTAQETVLRFLQQKYFVRNQPCFAKQSYLGYKLGFTQPRINQILKSLEEKNLIVRIQWLYKGRRQNSLILPLIPSLTPFFKNPEHQKIVFRCSYTTYKSLFCKPLKSQKYPTPYILYTNIIYANTLFKNNKVKLNSIVVPDINYSAEYPTETVGKSKPNVLVPKLVTVNNTETNTLGSKSVNSVERNNSIMLDRFILKRKKNESNTSVYKPLFDELKKHDYEFDLLSISQQNELNTYFEFYHFINIRTHFKIGKGGKDKKKGYVDKAIQIRKKLIQIIADGFELEWDHAAKVIEYWNSSKIDDKRFKRIKINIESKTYKNAIIAISHCLIYRAKRNINKLYKAIDRLSRSQILNRFPFHYHSSVVTIYNFFSDIEGGNKHDSIAYIGSDIEFERWIMQIKISRRHRERVNIAFDYFSKMYIDQFYSNHKEEGKEICYKFEFKIKQFLENRIIEIVDTRESKNLERVMHGYSLIEERSNNGYNIPPLLQRYLFYIYKNPPKIGENPYLFRNICNEETWHDFIETHMRIEVGLNDFYSLRRNK